VSPELRQLLGQLRESPALVLSSTLDILARNELADALHSGFALNDNSARMCFLDPLGRTFYADWTLTAEGAVAALRLAAGQAPRDQRLTALVEELSGASQEFRALTLTPSILSTDDWRPGLPRQQTLGHELLPGPPRLGVAFREGFL